MTRLCNRPTTVIFIWRNTTGHHLFVAHVLVGEWLTRRIANPETYKRFDSDRALLMQAGLDQPERQTY